MPPHGLPLSPVNSWLWQRPRVNVNTPVTEKSSVSRPSPSQGQKVPEMPLCMMRGCQECFSLYHHEAASGRSQGRDKQALPSIDLDREDTDMHVCVCHAHTHTHTHTRARACTRTCTHAHLLWHRNLLNLHGASSTTSPLGTALSLKGEVIA
jgi:hypothetical protein